jgi:hypothetical protein
MIEAMKYITCDCGMTIRYAVDMPDKEIETDVLQKGWTIEGHSGKELEHHCDHCTKKRTGKRGKIFHSLIEQWFEWTTLGQTVGLIFNSNLLTINNNNEVYFRVARYPITDEEGETIKIGVVVWESGSVQFAASFRPLSEAEEDLRVAKQLLIENASQPA